MSQKSQVSQGGSPEIRNPTPPAQKPEPEADPEACPHGFRAGGRTRTWTGRISDVLRTNRFDSALDLEQTPMRYVHPYNTQLPQSALGSRTPMQAMKDWYRSHPHLFVKTPRNRQGRET